jgi:signal peptidase II
MIRLIYAENTGAWGSLGEDWPEPVKLIVMTALPLVVLSWIGWKMVSDKGLPRIEALAYALIISGGVGNIIDRIRLGYVVDFMWMGVGPLTTNIFNIADLAIVGAMALLVAEAIRSHRQKKKLETASRDTSPSEM